MPTLCVENSTSSGLKIDQMHPLWVDLHVHTVLSPCAELEMGALIGAAGQALGLHTGLQPPDLAQVLTRESGAMPANRVDEVDESSRQVCVTGDRAGADEGLGFPDQRPPVVVRAIGIEAAHEWAVLALGAQVGVEADRGIGSGDAEEPLEVLDDAERLGLRLVLVGADAG